MFDLVFMIIYVILNIWLAIVDAEFRIFAILSIRVTSKQIDQYTLIRPDEFINVLNKMYEHTLQVTYDD